MISLTGPRPNKIVRTTLCAAFTLVELMLVVIVLAVIAGLAVPRFRGTFDRMQLRQAVSDLTYTMRYAQSRTLMRNKPHRLVFTGEYRSYKLLESAGSGEDGFHAISGRMGNPVSLAKSITLKAERESIDFFPDGSIQSEELRLCHDEQCYLVSTALQRGRVSVIRDESPPS